MTPTEDTADQPTDEELVRTGVDVGEVSVRIGPEFLRLFSEQMYSSPNKAFEELVSNSWDAGAIAIHIHVSDDLSADEALAWVLDNGESMDIPGLQQLWTVASSTKPQRTSGRPQIGKFGIGKLATYVLAHQLTYICQPQAGEILSITMDYRRIGKRGEGLHIDPLPLKVKRLTQTQLEEFLDRLPSGGKLQKLLNEGIPIPPSEEDGAEEYGGQEISVESEKETWTLALLTDLRPKGRDMQVGHIRRMLRAALPLGGDISIVFNGERLTSTKSDKKVTHEWILGPEIDVDEVTYEDGSYQVSTSDEPYPHITVQGVPGRITGKVRLYNESISGGKSEDIAASNGFFVNILGRVINIDDPYFGLENLNHSAWARFRATIRADGLNESLAVNREGVIETRDVAIFRALLRMFFNTARSAADSARRSEWPTAGQVLRENWGDLPLEPLRRLPRNSGEDGSSLPSVVSVEDIDDIAEAVEIMAEADNPLESVVFRELRPNEPLARLDVGQRQVIINKAHPFYREHGQTHEQQVLLRDVVLADLLTHLYLRDLGVPVDNLDEASIYQDQMLRLLARIQRKSAVTLKELLELVLGEAKPLEQVVGDALESLGFLVDRMGGTGEPEGVAYAPVSSRNPKEQATYSFTYDAKSTSKDNRKVANNDVKVSTLIRHRKKQGADHTLVVAPDYESGALEEECRRHRVTPMRAQSLANLLMLNATRGPLDLEHLRDLFDYYTPDDVADYVQSLAEVTERRIRYDDFFQTLEDIGYNEPDILTVSVIAREMRTSSGVDDFPTKLDVQKLVEGLSILAPQLIRTMGERIFVSTRPDKIRQAVFESLAHVPEEYRRSVGLVKVKDDDPAEESS